MKITRSQSCMLGNFSCLQFYYTQASFAGPFKRQHTGPGWISYQYDVLMYFSDRYRLFLFIFLLLFIPVMEPLKCAVLCSHYEYSVDCNLLQCSS